jgi:hypothetical protein
MMDVLTMHPPAMCGKARCMLLSASVVISMLLFDMTMKSTLDSNQATFAIDPDHVAL